MRHRILRLLPTLLLALWPALTLAQAGQAALTVVHGVPDLVVDVYANGNRVLSNFTFGTVTDPLRLAPGTYKLEIRPAGADPASAPVLSAEATLAAGQNASAVAHLSADGQPRLSVFVNDTARVASGKGRLIVRHTAQAPAVDVRAGGAVVFANLANPNEAKADVDAKTYAVALAPAGQANAVFGPVDLPVAAGAATIVYAIGSLQGGSFRLVTQVITGLGAPPTHVGTGLGPAVQAAPLPWTLVAAVVVLLTIGGLTLLPHPVLVQRRSR
ncbi:MAG: DUF4397 domain-containing protein [Thermomicrobium sp.]|nr:DUF4397 domain-containing protein [Thermomicrobium sp.]